MSRNSNKSNVNKEELSNGSANEMNESNSRDDLDSLLPQNSDSQRMRITTAVEHYLSKINRTKEAIKAEQNSRDENVNEYLKLASNADKVQLQRIKSVFEKKNQKSAQTVAHLQKKLDNYNKKIKKLETHVEEHRKHTRDMLRDVGQELKDVGVNIKEGITGLSGGVIGGIKSGISAAHYAGETVITKPREFFKNRFGSAENVSTADKTADESALNVTNTEAEGGGNTATKHSHSHSTKCTSDEESSSNLSGFAHIGPVVIASIGGSSQSPHNKQTNRAAASEAAAAPTVMIDIEELITQLKDRRDECHRLSDEFDSLKAQFQHEYSVLNQSLQEERYRFERLEGQMNDLIELHQNEIENLKQNMVDMEEKVQYQSEERLRDVHEMLETCQTRISRMEHQQHQHLQQIVNLDSLENSNARDLVLKLINVVLTILQVILLLVSTAANILAPFLQTRLRIITSIVVISAAMLLQQQWPDFGSWVRTKLHQNWAHFFTHENG